MCSADLDLILFRGAITGRAALHNVGNEEVFPAQAIAREYLIEKASGGADERPTAGIFFFPGRLANNHHLCRRLALARNGNGPRSVQRTLCAVAYLCRQRRQFLSYFLSRRNRGAKTERNAYASL
jgi:hypothetical protein